MNHVLAEVAASGGSASSQGAVTRRRPALAAAVGLLALAPVLGLTACAAGPAFASGEDGRIIAQLAEIAPRDAGLTVTTEVGSGADGADPGARVRYVECWKPSESMIDETAFRVLCRVHYSERGTETEAGAGAGTETGAGLDVDVDVDVERYRDVICIGDVRDDPPTEYCYRWAFYSDMPVFEDQRAYRAA